MTADPMPMTSLTNDQIEGRLCRLAGQIAAAECEFLLLLAEYDVREGWGHWGMRSAAHWLSMRCGMRLCAARERVRVARALMLLPQVRDAFAAGRLSYCKVRALTRVASPKTEQELVEIALGATGSQLESIVRAWRTVLSEDMGASHHICRGVKRRDGADGSVQYVVRLAPEEAAVVDAALAAARRAVVDDDGRPVETPEEAALAKELTGESPEIRAAADAFLLMAESFLATGSAAEKPDVYQVVIHADVDALVDLRATTDANGSRDSVPDEPVPDEPVPDEPVPDEPVPDEPVPAGPASAQPTIDPLFAAARFRDASRGGRSVHEQAKAAGPAGCVVENGSQVSAATVLRLLCHSTATVMLHESDGRPYDLGRSVRHATRKQRMALMLRDGGCRFPGCTRRTHLIPHHVRWWSHGGTTDLDNLVMVCGAHHRAVHELGYSIAVLGAGRFHFFRPDGRQVPGPGDVVLGEQRPSSPVDQPDVGPFRPGSGCAEDEPIVPMWGGGRLDLQLLISALANNVLLDGGYDVATTASRDLPAAIRAAAEWPLEVERRRHVSQSAA